MVDKIKALLTSVRFWIITLTTIVMVLEGKPFMDALQLWSAAVVGLGTLDGVASRFAGTKV